VIFIPNNMIPKKRRILRKEFAQILRNGRRYNTSSLLLYQAPIISDRKTTESKFSFSVPKKAYPKAVDRNKHRRRGYSVIYRHLEQIKSGYYCFFSFKKITKPTPFPLLEKEILELLSLSGMLI